MTDLPALRASDADRDRTIVLLREHTAVGRLTLEEFTDRMSAAALARTHVELEELTRDLPAAEAPVVARRRATRFVLSIFGSVERHGRFRAGRRIVCVMAFGSVDLDLRQATAEHPVITIFALGGFGAIDVYVPEGVEVDLHGFVIFGHKGERGNDPPPLPGTPLVRVFTLAAFAGVDAWRVPRVWSAKSCKQVVRAFRKGAHKELEP